MAKYNLMDTEKPDYFDRYFDEDDDKKEKSKSKTDPNQDQSSQDIDDREYFDESLFTEEEAPETSTIDDVADIQVEKPTEAPPPTQPKKELEQQEVIKEPEPVKPQPGPVQKPKTEISEYDYEDSKIQGINWKPLIVWGSIFIGVLVVVFFLYTWFFSNGEEKDVAEQKPVVSPQEQLRIEQQNKKIAFIKNIVGQKKARLNNFSNLAKLKVTNAVYSSVLLYENSFNFEVFGGSRDDLAKFNQNLKNKNFANNAKLVTVSTRPGSNGGIFALFNVEGSSVAAQPQSANPKIDNAIQNSIENLFNTNGLKIKSARVISRQKVDQFEVVRKEIISSGTETASMNLLQELKNLNSNFNVHKVTLIPSNQKDIKSSKYNLSIVFDFYI